MIMIINMQNDTDVHQIFIPLMVFSLAGIFLAEVKTNISQDGGLWGLSCVYFYLAIFLFLSYSPTHSTCITNFDIKHVTILSSVSAVLTITEISQRTGCIYTEYFL